MKIKDLPIEERPRERLEKVGIENISNEELLAILLKNGSKGNSVKDMAMEILKKIASINNLQDINYYSLGEIKGLGRVKIMELMSAIELGKRVFLQKEYQKKTRYCDAKTIYSDNKYLFFNKKQEYFYCLYLDNKNQLIERKLLFMGTINRSIVHPREIFKEAYLLSASSIICMHNHPSGDITPSEEDVMLTKSLVEIGRIQGIQVIDHLIVSDRDYYSFYDNGHII